MRFRLTIGMFFCALVFPRIALADVKIWDGGGADANWMTPQNWVGDVAPVPNVDSLEFPEGAARKSNSNNFPAGSLFLGIQFSGATGGYVVSGNVVLFDGPVTSVNTSGTNTITFPITTSSNGLAGLTAVSAGGTLSATGGITLSSGPGPAALSLDGAGIIHIAGHLQGTGNLVKSGAGTAILTYSNTYTGGTAVYGGSIFISGVQAGSPVTMMSGTVGGAGTLGDLTAYSGFVSPGLSAGILRAGNTTLSGGTTLRVEVNGSVAGFGYDQLSVTGTLDLGGAILNATLGYVPANSAQFTIVNNDGTDAVIGAFADLPEGSTFMMGSRSFTISYLGGTGNDIVLTANAISFISGTVTNATTGAPVANTQISFHSNNGGVQSWASTNAQGTYVSEVLPSGTYFVMAQPQSASGLLGQLYNNLPCQGGSCTVTSGTPVAVMAPGGAPNINFALVPGAAISGGVSNASTSARVPNTAVTIYSSSGAAITSAYTDDQGFYRTTYPLATGTYFVKANPPPWSGVFGQLYNNLPCPDGDCTATSGTPVAVTAPNTTNVNFALPASGRITGVVTNAATGTPVADTYVYVYSSSGELKNLTYTNTQGVYATSTTLPNGSYFVKALPPPLSAVLALLYNNLPCPERLCSVTNGTPVHVTSPNTTIANFALPLGGTITGTVTNVVTGAPVAGTSIAVFSSTGEATAFAVTNGQGVYATTTGLPTGSYFVRAVPPASAGVLGQLYSNLLCHDGGCSATTGTPVPVTAPNATTINFALAVGATITGTVTNATTSSPVLSVVRIFGSAGQQMADVQTDANGFYVSPTLPNGSYYLLAFPLVGDLVAQLYKNIPCPQPNCPVLSGTPVAATGPTPNINFALVQPPLATNDTFAMATVIPSLPYQSMVNTASATTTSEDPVVSCGNNSTQRSVWYLYTPAANGPVAFNTVGSSYGTILAVYTGSPGSFVSAGCDSSSSASKLIIQGIAGQRLAILVTAYSGSQSGGILALNVANAPAAFEKTAPAAGATTRPTSVTLSWAPSADAAAYEYCIDTSHNNSCGANWVAVGNATSVGLTGMLPNTQYSWQVRALNVGATTYAQGSTTAFWSFTTRPSPLVDLNGDRRGDVFAHTPATGAWQRQTIQADGSFASVAGGWSAGWTPVSATFDADALSDFFLFSTTSGAWTKLLTTSVGFTAQATGAWWPGWERHVMDLDGDGLSDLFLYDPATGTWFKCLSTPTGFTYVQGGWNPGWEIYPMRLNDDAVEDMFLINRTTGRWFWVLGSASDSFTYPMTETWFYGWQLYPGDFNGDGLTDLLLHDPPTGSYFVATTTASGFTYHQGGWSLGWTPYVADLDADGKDDLFLHDSSTGVWFQMLSDGAGNFTNVGGETWSLGWKLHPTDFNDDGRADLLLYHPETGVWYQARNLGDGTFSYTNGNWAPGLTVLTRAPIR